MMKKHRQPEPIPHFVGGKSAVEKGSNLEMGKPSGSLRFLDRLRGITRAVEPVELERGLLGEKRIERRRLNGKRGVETVEYVTRNRYLDFQTETIYELATGACIEFRRSDARGKLLRSAVREGKQFTVCDFDPALDDLKIVEAVYDDGMLKRKTNWRYQRFVSIEEVRQVQAGHTVPKNTPRLVGISETIYADNGSLLSTRDENRFFDAESTRIRSEVSEMTFPESLVDSHHPDGALKGSRTESIYVTQHSGQDVISRANITEFGSASQDNKNKPSTWPQQKTYSYRKEVRGQIAEVSTRFCAFHYADGKRDAQEEVRILDVAKTYTISLGSSKVESATVYDYRNKQYRRYRRRKLNEAIDPTSPDDELVLDVVGPITGIPAV